MDILCITTPKKGRQRHLRKKLLHIKYEIIGDRPLGCNKQNKMFKEKFGLMTMILHAKELTFTHPVTKAEVRIVAEIQSEFRRMIDEMNFDYHV